MLRYLTPVIILALWTIRPGAPTPQAAPQPDLTDVTSFNEQAPETYLARFETSVGIFIVRVTREWAPHGADRFYNLVKRGFYDQCRFFRVVKDFVAQFGIHGDPVVATAWSKAAIRPDRATRSNTRGRVTFAMAGPADRTTQVFINFADNSRLDINGFAPIGEVITSLLLVERLYHEYGEGPDQGEIERGGNAFLSRFLPRLDYIKTARLIAAGN